MPLKLGMLGMWHTHADGIVRRVSENPDEFRLVGFWDSDAKVMAERRKQWEPRIKDFRLFDSGEALLREPLDGVVVEGRVYENVKLARQALESGHPVMLEKPAGDKPDDFPRLIDLAQRKHLHVQMIYLFRYMSAVQEMLKLARKGDLGDVYEFRGRLPKELSSYDRFVEELKPYKGGMFFEMAGHLVDMMVAILGKPEKVTGFMAHHHTRPPASYIDNGVAVFEFRRALGIIEVPSLEVVPHTRRIEVYGTGGACVIPHLGSGHLANRNVQPIDVYRAKQDKSGKDNPAANEWQRTELPAATLQIADLREFAAVVSGKKTPDFSHEHDLIVQRALLQACEMA
jgi:predicted dehydrogenase